MLRLSITFVVVIAVLSWGEAPAADDPRIILSLPVRAEKPWPFTRREPEDDAPRDRLPIGSNAESQKPTALYLQVKKFYDEGGQQWLEVGVPNTIDNAIRHLVEEHHFKREQLIGYDVVTLNWIHGMAHERGNPEPEELPLRAER